MYSDQRESSVFVNKYVFRRDLGNDSDVLEYFFVTLPSVVNLLICITYILLYLDILMLDWNLSLYNKYFVPIVFSF